MPILHVPMPNGGLAESSAQASVPTDKAYDLTNFLVDSPGQLRMRGAIGAAVDLYGANVTQTGIWVYNENILACGDATTTAKFYDGSTVTDVTLTDATCKLQTNRRSARLGAYAYGPSNDTTVALLRWGGTAATPSVLTHAPRGSADVAVHLNRLFVAGGTEPNTASPAKPNTLWWSDIGGPTTNTLVDWQDDVSGLTNQLVIGDDGDAIVGLASLQGQLLVFKHNSIWTVLGTSPSAFSVRKLAGTMGVTNPLSVLVVDDTCVFTNNSSQPYVFDGVSFARLLRTAGIVDIDIVRLRDDYLLWGNSLLFYIPTKSWARVSFGSGVIGASSCQVMTELGVPYNVDVRYIRPLASLVTTTPTGYERNAANSADVAIVPDVVTRLHVLATPDALAVIKRLFVGSTLTASGGAGTAAWSVILGGFAGTIATYSIASDTLTNRTPVDAYVEVPDFAVAVTYAPTGGVPHLTAATLEDIYVDWSLAQQR